MIRRAYREESHSHERWVISYADFITLLFAFFVVMYSVSSVNEGKYKVLTETLEDVFSASHKQRMPFSIGEHNADQVGGTDKMIKLPMPGSYNSDQDYEYSTEGEKENVASEGNKNTGLEQISHQISGAFEDLIQNDELRITATDLWVEVEIKSSVLFASGDAQPNPKASDLISNVAKILRDYPNPIHVEGFTDNVPIATNRYPSNWELSSARAAAIVRLLIQGRVDPRRLAAVGYGEYQPVASNETEEGRRKNRRVVLVISRDLNVRRTVSAVGVDQAQKKTEVIQGLQQDLKNESSAGIEKVEEIKQNEAEEFFFELQ